MQNFRKLFEPGTIGKIEVRNRTVFAPCVTFYADHFGYPTDQLIEYYAARAKGGTGLIVVEATYPRTGGYGGRLFLYHDKFIPGLRKLVEAIHEGGAKAVLQLNTHRGAADEFDPATPSGIPHPFVGWMADISPHPRILTVADLERLAEEFGEGARRAMEAGFDGIMPHFASGYVCDEFISPRFNKRTDEYGGDLRGRAKFLLDLVRKAREKTASDYPIIPRLMGDDRLSRLGISETFSTKDCVELCKIFEELGVAGIDITSGSEETHDWVAPPMYLPSGLNADISEAIKRAGVKVPIWVAGKIVDPDLAEKILLEEKADFISMGRGLIADPEWANKAKEGRVGDIRKCIFCGHCCDVILVRHYPLTCTVNPFVGKEGEFEQKIKPLTKKKRVLVIGGGPAGMKAAIMAAKKGHDVTLWEQKEKLGGQLILAALPPEKHGNASILRYLRYQLEKLPVKVELRKEATIEEVKKFSPGAVIVATGSSTRIPDIPGIRGKNVITCREVLAGKKKVGDRVVVMGGGYVGCDTCFFLAERGKVVTLVFGSKEPVLDMQWWAYRKHYLDKLKEENVKVMPRVKYKEITPKGIKLINEGGKEVFLEADTIVLATGATPDKALGESLKGKFLEYYEVGDCVDPRRIHSAICEGAWAGLAI